MKSATRGITPTGLPTAPKKKKPSPASRQTADAGDARHLVAGNVAASRLARTEKDTMKMKDLITSWIANNLLPRRVVKWALVRAYAHASYKQPQTEITTLTPVDVLKMWDEK